MASLLASVGYYRNLIQNFSKLAKCLHKLTEKGRKFEWTNECQSAFEELKNRLAHPDFSKKFILDTDASNEAIAGFLKFKSHLCEALSVRTINCFPYK
jgi:hypothetical protein